MRALVQVDKIVTLDDDNLLGADVFAQATVKFFKEKAEGRDKRKNFDAAQIELAIEKTRKLRLENDQTEKMLVPIDEHEQLLNEITSSVLEQFSKAEIEIPALIAINPEDKQRITEITNRWFRAARQRLADAFEQEDS